MALRRSGGRADAGQRDHLVMIQHIKSVDVDAVDDAGAPEDRWTSLGTVWMSKRDVSQSEKLAAMQLSAPVDTEWQMPFQSNMDPEAVDVPKLRRLLYRTRPYDISAARVEPRSEGNYIVLETVARSG